MPNNRDHSRRLLGFSRQMRHEQTDAERIMWSLLRDRKLDGFKFRRQHPIEGYIADFFCLRAKLVVELDGGQHSDADEAAYDQRRTARLAALGIRVLRFWDHDVLRESDAILETTYNALHPPDGSRISASPNTPGGGGDRGSRNEHKQPGNINRAEPSPQPSPGVPGEGVKPPLSPRGCVAIALVTCCCACVAHAVETPLMREPNRPQFHFTPERNWLNDPNGLVFFKGEWHLFHQYNPQGIESANKSWAHAVSRDLVHWQHLPLAIRFGDGIEIWSGSAVVDAANTSGLGTKDNPPLVAIYTGAGHGKQTQNLAYSTDRGRTWTKFAGNPVIDENLREFRDPKVCWYEPTKRWVMVVALSDERKVRFYSSPDLKQWTRLSEFGGQGSLEGIWECPDLFPLALAGKTYWILVVNVGWGGPAVGSAAQYFVGDFDGTTYRNANAKEVVLWTNYGPDSYAEQTWSDVPPSDGRRISMGWMSNTRYCTQEPTLPWRGGLTLPRELSLVETKSGPRLAQSPVRELWKLRGEKLSENQFATAGHTLEIDVTIERGRSCSFHVCADDRTRTTIGYDAAKQEVYVDRTRSRVGEPFHKDFPGRYVAPLVWYDADGATIPLRVFVDRTSVEVFADDGLTVLTVNTFADPGAVRLLLPVGMKSYEVWRLNSIWNTKE